MNNFGRNEKIALLALIVALCSCLGTYLTVPQVQRLIEQLSVPALATQISTREPRVAVTARPSASITPSKMSVTMAPTLSKSNDWVQLGLTGDTISGIVGNESEIYAATYGHEHGVFRSIDNGGTWQAVNNGLVDFNLWNLGVDSSGNLYAGSDDGLVISKDDGNTWRLCGEMDDPPWTEIRTLAVDESESGTVWATIGAKTSGGQGLARSLDQCKSWEERTIVGGDGTEDKLMVIDSCGTKMDVCRLL